MTSDAISVLQVLFHSVWSLFNSWFIPGTHTTPLAFALFIIVANMSIKFISRLGIHVQRHDDPDA